MRRRHRGPRWIAIVAAVATTGAGAFAYFGFLQVARPAVPGLSGRFTLDNLVSGGRQRRFGLYRPARLAKPTPLLVALHASGETGERFRRDTGDDFDRLADANGFVVAYPDGWERHWDDCRAVATYSARTEHVDDVAFIRALVDHLRQTAGIDSRMVFAVGHSNGAQMAYRLALEAPDLVRGVAAISAGLPTADNLDCRPSGKAVSMLIMNGTADPLNPYQGGRVTIFGFGDRGPVRSTVDSARYFVGLDDLPPTPSVERLTGGNNSLWAERSIWHTPGHAGVELVTLHGGGHVVPQAFSQYPRVLGRIIPGFDGPAEIWRFFSQLTR